MKTSVLSLFASLLLVTSSATTHCASWVRVNQLGYLPASTKVAVLVSTDSTLDCKSFEVVETLTGAVMYRSKSVRGCGPYAAFKSTFRLDLTPFKTPGAYFVLAAGQRSPVFRIAADVYDHTADFLLKYMRQQRCGYNPFLDDSCHTQDGYIIYHPTRDSSFIDVVGGWHDASDYLQYVTTSANAVFQMLFAYESHPEVFSDAFAANGRPGANGVPDILDEARWGTQWLLKMNPAPEEMYNQIADDRDHLGFRLPSLDTVNYGRGKERPVYFCTGTPQGVFQYKNRATGIASTAGKYASAFALGSMVFAKTDTALAARLSVKALEAYAFGEKHPGVCQTAPCRAPYFYEEDNWVDDMELAATQLYRLTHEERYLNDAQKYGVQEPVTPWMGAERARHYQWYPFLNLGHVYAARARQKQFVEFLRDGLQRVFDRGKNNPFLFGVPFVWCSNNFVSALVTQACLYRELTGDRTFEPMEASLRDWLFGNNPWGTSMIIGLPKDGTAPRDPHSAFSHVYGRQIDGGLVDGPVYGDIFASLKGVALSKPDPFAPFQSSLAVYHDDWADYSTDEPTMDGTASLTYYLSAMEAEGKSGFSRAVFNEGGIIRCDTTKKEIYLVFTGHEFADGAEVIRATLKKHGIRASFFFTGDFYRAPHFRKLIAGLKHDGHYLGPHSDKHLLYAFWEKRDSLLVSRGVFEGDLRDNFDAMAAFGIERKNVPYLMPPFEWYNRQISDWARAIGLQIVNFTPGTSSNADYTTPDMGEHYVSSDTIYSRILAFEHSKPNGLNGFLLLSHIGTDPHRTDKFYRKLDPLITSLKKRGYHFKRL